MIIDQYVFAKYEPFLICMAVVIVILNETNQTWNEYMNWNPIYGDF